MINYEWHPIEAPTMVELPDWIGGLHIDWMLGWANDPRLIWKMVKHMPCDSATWKNDGKSRWWREADGTMEQLWHTTQLQECEQGFETVTHQQGFGGRTFKIEPVEGLDRPVFLRGPWFGGSQTGWQECTTVDWEKAKLDKYYNSLNKPWHERMANFGNYISEDLVIRALAKFHPHLGIARVRLFEDYWHAEPYMLEWGCPKAFRGHGVH